MNRSKNMATDTRENWLIDAMRAFHVRLFKPAGYDIPKQIRVSVGFPLGRRKGHNSIGQCWTFTASTDGHVEIFISPEISGLDDVLATLVHEICHAVVGNEAGHNKVFGKCARAVKLEGKLTATVASEELKTLFAEILKKDLRRPYPHAMLNSHIDDATGPKKQGTRLLKVLCPACGYTVRIAQKWIDAGFPVCPCGEAMEQENGEDDE